MVGEEEIEFLILPIEICRICTNLQSNLDILTDKLEDENVLLHEALEFVSCIRIDFNDGMSRTMCLTCCKKLSDAYKFKNQILDSYRAFYKQTSDVNFKRDDLIYEEDSVIDDTEANSSIDSKLEDEPALVIERANELGIKLSTNAISFILEQNNCKTRGNIKQSPSQENLLADEEKATVIDAKPYKPPPLEENNKVQQVCRPYIKVETTPIEQTHQNAPSLKSKGPSIEDDQNNYIKSPPSAQTNKKAKETLNTRSLETNSTLLDNRRCRTTRNNSSLKSQLECHICHKILPKKSNLRDHMRLHANEKNFVCSYCEKGFVQVANYRMHLRVHTKERPYQCHLCPKTYSQGGSLKMHIRSHTKERNYVCEVCLRDFTNSSDLGKHKRIHDPSQHFACETCGRLFSQRINLKTHVRKVHSKAKQIKTNS